MPRSRRLRSLSAGLLAGSLAFTGSDALPGVGVAWAQEEPAQEKPAREEPVQEEPARGADAPPLADEKAVDPREDREELLRLMREFADSFEQIERNYVSEVSREELLEAAIDGMVAKLDPYSTYLDDEEVGLFTREVEGQFIGIGVQILPDTETGRLTITAPLPGTPAAEAGVRAGDMIVKVDGESVDGLDPSAVTARIKGPEGEPVKLGLMRPGQEEPLEITVVRADVRVPTVLGESRRADGSWDYLLPSKNSDGGEEGEPKIGLLRVTRFGAGTDRELTEALLQLKEAGAEGVILDLRGNPGGLLDQAVAVADLFLKEGRIVSTAGRNVASQSFDALPGGPAEGLKVAVLVDRFSASASEIVSAALQDANRAVVIGERTWGKGSVQTVINLGGGRTALKLTTAAYLRPSGANIQRPGPINRPARQSDEDGEWGVTPNEGYRIPLTLPQRRNLNIDRIVRDRPAGAVAPEQDEEYEPTEDPHIAAALKVLTEDEDESSNP
ncbi:S41 family peptidase [Alienimonas californiensis]|uniref:Putative CtpA-like serine protease n=1 Tax=Alienimonas californiensis TaxID=2527989 RepID=A0A517PCX8_9PLAN|nr:S41 family peptidase [Alienimonas californiensis]QDT17230.1 putative CtpA-like serine protease [Alienimonas californiensis]